MKENIFTLPAGRPKDIPALAGMSSNNHEKNFTFEGRKYRAVHNAPGYAGLMIFTVGGMAMEKYQFPELWMYYEYQKDFLKTTDPIFQN